MFERRTKNVTNMVNGLANNTEMDDNSNCDATVVLLKKGNCSSKSTCLLVELLTFNELETQGQSRDFFNPIEFHPWDFSFHFPINSSNTDPHLQVPTLKLLFAVCNNHCAQLVMIRLVSLLPTPQNLTKI